jgi:hypothetical protein
MRRRAVGRRLVVAHPCGQRGQQRAHRPELRIGVRLLLAISERRVRRQRQRRRAMLRARHDEGAHVGRVRDVALAERIGEPERLAPFPQLQRGRDMEQPRAGVGRCTAVEQALGAQRQRVDLLCVGEGEIIGGIEVIDLLAPGARRLAEAHVQRHQAAADMGIGPIEHALTGFVSVESEREKTADHPPALRGAL